MALKITRKAPGWEGAIAGGNTLTLRLPIGLTYHQVFVEYAFATADPAALSLEDAVDEIRVVLNGKPIWNISAAELNKKNQFESRAAAAGILTIDFDRYNLRNRNSEELTSIGTGSPGDETPVTTFVIEMVLKSAVASGSVSARIRQSETRPLGLFKKLRKFTYTYGGSGEQQIADFPKGDLINAIYLFESANDIDSLRILRDNIELFDRSKELNARIQSDGVRTPQENLYVYDTAEDGNGVDQLVTQGVHDLRLYLNIDGAMTLTPIVEYIGALER